MRRDFIESTLRRIAEAMERAATADDAGSVHGGFLQRLDPRVKLAGFLGLIVAAAASQRIVLTAALFATGLALALASGVARPLARLWAGVLGFAGLVTFPALFLVPGPVLCCIPGTGWAVTAPGLHSAAALVARGGTTATFAALLVLTTPWGHLLQALRILRVPALFVVILGMTHRFLFHLLGLARDFFEARRARRVGRLDGPQRRQMAVSSAAILFVKSIQLSSEVYEAMQARGFRGEARTLHAFRMRRLDWCMLALFMIATGAALALGIPK